MSSWKQEIAKSPLFAWRWDHIWLFPSFPIQGWLRSPIGMFRQPYDICLWTYFSFSLDSGRKIKVDPIFLSFGFLDRSRLFQVSFFIQRSVACSLFSLCQQTKARTRFYDLDSWLRVPNNDAPCLYAQVPNFMVYSLAFYSWSSLLLRNLHLTRRHPVVPCLDPALAIGPLPPRHQQIHFGWSSFQLCSSHRIAASIPSVNFVSDCAAFKSSKCKTRFWFSFFESLSPYSFNCFSVWNTKLICLILVCHFFLFRSYWLLQISLSSAFIRSILSLRPEDSSWFSALFSFLYAFCRYIEDNVGINTISHFNLRYSQRWEGGYIRSWKIFRLLYCLLAIITLIRYCVLPLADCRMDLWLSSG